MTLGRVTQDIDWHCALQNALQYARQSLDHIVYRFLDVNKQYFRCKCGASAKPGQKCTAKCKSRPSYPYLFKDEKELHRLLCDSGLKDLDSVQNHCFKMLFDFIYQHSKAGMPKEYGWIPDYIELIDKHKHQNSIPITADNAEEMYELAHKAADFAEDVVLQFSNHLAEQ